MQAHQLLTALSYGDAIGDYTLEIQRILRGAGYESEIFSEVVHPRIELVMSQADGAVSTADSASSRRR